MHASAKSLEAIFARTTISPLSVGHVGLDSIAFGIAVTGDYHRSLEVQPPLDACLHQRTTFETALGGSNQLRVLAPSFRFEQIRYRRNDYAQPDTVFCGRGRAFRIFRCVSWLGSGCDHTAPSPWASQRPRTPISQCIQYVDRGDGTPSIRVSIDQAREEMNTIFRNISLDAARSSTADSDNARLARETNLLVRPAARGFECAA